MTGHVYVSDSDREFRAVYGVTPGEVDEAIEENRSRIIRKLNEWGQVWAVDEIVMNIWQELIEGGLKRWASYATADRWARSSTASSTRRSANG